MVGAFDLGGKVALVTGASRGIGRAIAHGLAGAGASVALVARDAARTATVAAEVEARGGTAASLPGDITDRADRERALAAVRERYGGLDILVNNAARLLLRPPTELTEAEWDRTLDTNLKAAFFLCQAAYPLFVARGGGKVINLSSTGADFGYSGSVAYGVSKAGIEALTRSLAQGWAADNIQVNTLVPGMTRSDMTPGLAQPERAAFFAGRIPAGRLGEPEDVVGAAVFLASRAADYLTGQRLVVDGGILVASPFRP